MSGYKKMGHGKRPRAPGERPEEVYKRFMSDVSSSLPEHYSKVLDKVLSMSLDDLNTYSYLTLYSLRYNVMKILEEDKESYKEKLRDLKRFVGDNPSSKERLQLIERLVGELNCAVIEKRVQRVKELLRNVRSALRANGYEVLDVKVETTFPPLIVGTGSFFGRLIFDIGLAFHPILNVPYIPASSIKGAMRSYVNLVMPESEKKLFGDKEEKGDLIITDAFVVACRDPFKGFLFRPEVTTPIYSEVERRIEEHKARPVPITYLTIAENVTFNFLVAYNPKLEPRFKGLIIQWLDKVLEMGLGAKTLLGYGVMKRREEVK